ncbi:hypothetical protein AN958_08112, partial [Leucoagaricus sp. SymC.cos]
RAEEKANRYKTVLTAAETTAAILKKHGLSCAAFGSLACKLYGDFPGIIGQQAFRLLQSAGNFVPVPAIGLAAGVALSILELVQTVKSNKEEFKAIGKDACTIMVTVVQRVNLSANGHGASMDLAVLEQDSQQLLGDMKEIKKVVQKHIKKRGLVRRMLHVFSDQETIQECRDRLIHALQLFGLQSDIEMRKQLAFLSGQVAELLEHQRHSQAPQMPQPHPAQMPQPYSSHIPQSHTPQTPQPQSPPVPNLLPGFPQTPTPSFPVNNPPQTRRDRNSPRYERKDAVLSSQAMNSTGANSPGFAPDSTFSNIHNHLSPGGNINYSVISGNLTQNTRDDSFRVAGQNNSISIALQR